MGSRVLKLINLIGYTEYLKTNGVNVEFVNTPLQYEGFQNFGSNELASYSPTAVVDNRGEYLDICKRWDTMLGVKGKQIIDVDLGMVTSLIHANYNNDPKAGPEIQQIVRDNKEIIKNRLTLPKKVDCDYIDVAVHIRRGDVTTADWTLDRYLDDDFYLKILQDIKDTLGDRCRITIHTQRGRYHMNFNHELYSDYEILYDDESVDSDVWVKLVQADVLVMGISSYSYSAALLSDGLCVYPPGQEKVCGAIMNDWVTPENMVDKLKLKYNT
jgi:hypothetical protein